MDINKIIKIPQEDIKYADEYYGKYTCVIKESFLNYDTSLNKNKKVHINENEITNKIQKVLEKSKVSMTTLELKQLIPEINRTLLRKLVRQSIIKETSYYADNCAKTFMHHRTMEVETIKGTYFYKYGLVD